MAKSIADVLTAAARTLEQQVGPMVHCGLDAHHDRYRISIRCNSCGGSLTYWHSERRLLEERHVLTDLELIQVRLWVRTHECKPIDWSALYMTGDEISQALHEHECALERLRGTVMALRNKKRRLEGKGAIEEPAWISVACDALREGDLFTALKIMMDEAADEVKHAAGRIGYEQATRAASRELGQRPIRELRDDLVRGAGGTPIERTVPAIRRGVVGGATDRRVCTVHGVTSTGPCPICVIYGT